MDEHKPRNSFDIPAVFYFEVGNMHSGSRDQLRFFITPADGMLHADTWNEDVCYEIAQERGILSGHADFPLSEEGFQQMIAFLQAEYDKNGADSAKTV
ncbi:MAG: hypothetical protein IKQ39_08835 [Oscillospiraceae bacterium]|nr:hypothetical protein [Oscillospiraceae bacterium]